MMSAGSFIAACMSKSRAALQAANIESAARQHQIPTEWARFYLTNELNRSDRRK